MLSDALAAMSQVFSPPFRAVLFKSVGLTLCALVVLGVGLWFSLGWAVAFVPWDWAQTALQALGGVGVVIALVFLVAPVTSLVAGLFLDDIAETVEREAFPLESPGRALPFFRSLVLSLKFFGAVLLANLVALVLLLIPGVNLIAFLLANGYLLGREYFELAGMRHRPPDEVRELRRANAARVFVGGLVIAAVVAIPVVNLVTPLFATAFMVRYHKRLAARAPDQTVLAG